MLTPKRQADYSTILININHGFKTNCSKSKSKIYVHITKLSTTNFYFDIFFILTITCVTFYPIYYVYLLHFIMLTNAHRSSQIHLLCSLNKISMKERVNFKQFRAHPRKLPWKVSSIAWPNQLQISQSNHKLWYSFYVFSHCYWCFHNWMRLFHPFEDVLNKSVCQ